MASRVSQNVLRLSRKPKRDRPPNLPISNGHGLRQKKSQPVGQTDRLRGGKSFLLLSIRSIFNAKCAEMALGMKLWMVATGVR
jgi:hypothetical protein